MEKIERNKVIRMFAENKKRDEKIQLFEKQGYQIWGKRGGTYSWLPHPITAPLPSDLIATLATY